MKTISTICMVGCLAALYFDHIYVAIALLLVSTYYLIRVINNDL